MERSITGSVLAGFGVLSQVLIERGLSSAANFSLLTHGLVWLIILSGLGLLTWELYLKNRG